jgi:hypothetical protein
LYDFGLILIAFRNAFLAILNPVPEGLILMRFSSPKAVRRLVVGSVLSIIALFTSGCGIQAPTITTQPADRVAYLLQPASFKVIANGDSLTYQWQKNGTVIAGATNAVYATKVTAEDNGAKFQVTVTNSKGSVVSSSAALTVTSGIDVPTYHYDNMRSGEDLAEKALTPSLVTSSTFGLLGSFAVDGRVDGQPLYLSNLTIPGVGPKNVLYVVTEHGTVFAFDADSTTAAAGKPLWSTSTSMQGETPSDDRDCPSISPEIGITATPVIDRARGAIYVEAVSKDASGNYYQRLHALDLTTGKELFGGPTLIAGTYPGTGANSTNGIVTFDPTRYLERAALLEVNGTIFLTWSSHCDLGAYTSWVMAYSADSLQQTGVLDLVPNGSDGGIWMSGSGPAADAAGNIYLTVGNGTFDGTLDANGFPAQKDCGNCFIKISSTTPLTLLDYFTTSDTASESATDHDFGSGGPLLLPDVTDATGAIRHLAISGAKDSNLYVVDRDNLGKFNSSADSNYQTMKGMFVGMFYSKGVYFNGVVYLGASSDAIKAFPVVGGKLATGPKSQSVNKFFYPGATPTITANGTGNAIVWAIDNGASTGTTAILFAYDATNLGTELYDSTQALNSRDSFTHNKFITPLAVNGQVYAGTPNSVVVFGLLP